jgi:hypothetical protein
VIRQTYGWNRKTTCFSWYRIAMDLRMDRGGIVRAGHHLLRSGILQLQEGEIGIEQEGALWSYGAAPGLRQETMTGVSDDGSQRKAMTTVSESDDQSHRKRCPESSLFRRAKDSSKDNIKKKRNTTRMIDGVQRNFRNGAFREQHHPAGAARPIPGKYDSFSQNR